MRYPNIVEFSIATSETKKKKKKNAFQFLRENDLQPRILHLAKLSIKIENRMKTFSDMQLCQTFIPSAFCLKKLLEGVLHQNEGIHQEKGSHGVPEPGDT